MNAIEQFCRLAAMPVWGLNQRQVDKICEVARGLEMNFVTREDAARMLHKDVKTIDRFVREGRLVRVYMAGASRALGISKDSLEKLAIGA